MNKIQTITAWCMILFILSVPLMVGHSENRAYGKGLTTGSDFTRESMEIDMNNGWTYEPQCYTVNASYPQNATLILCKGIWHPPGNNYSQIP